MKDMAKNAFKPYSTPEQMVAREISKSLRDGGASKEDIASPLKTMHPPMVTGEKIDLESRIIEIALDVLHSLGLFKLTSKVHGDVIDLTLVGGGKAAHQALYDRLRFNRATVSRYARPLDPDDIEVFMPKVGNKVRVTIKNATHTKTYREFRRV